MKKRLIFVAVFLPLLGLALFLRTFTGSVVAKPQMIDVGGSISTDTTWTFTNSPYIITDTVTVEAGVTLTIEAGVTVMTTVDQYLIVLGHLEAVGTAVNPIIFTSIDNLPANNWSGITVSGSANFEHVTMRHAYTALFISNSSGGNVNMTDTTLEENLVYPIVVNTDALHRLKMDNVTFSNNVSNRVGIETAGGNLSLAGSPTLEPQPGLEGYEELNTDIPTVFSVPAGITLTLEPGTNLMMLSTVQVAGHVSASGTEVDPITWQTVPESDGGVFSVIVLPTGTAVISQTILQGSPNLGMAVVGESDRPVIIENSVLQDMGDYPLLIEPASLHRVQMDNVTFLNNTANRVLVDTTSGNAIAGDVTLTAQPGLEAYEFTKFSAPPGQFTVSSGVTMTVESGVELQFGIGAEEFVVNGRLQAIGTQAQPITFTSAADSAPDQWSGMMVENGSAQLDYVDVRYAENNISVNNTAVSNTFLLENSQIHHGASAGLSVLDGTVTAVCTTFNNNGITGIVVWDTGNPSVQISSSSLVGNSDSGLLNNNSSQVDARNNWWGDATGPAGIGPGSGDAVLGDVLFTPWLPEETCTTVPYQLYLPSVIKP